MDLNAWFNVFNQFVYEKDIPIDQLTVHVRPYTYKEVTKTALKSMEQQRIFQVINDDSLSDEQKLEKFGASFLKLTELTVDIIADCITSIDAPDGSVTDKDMIKDFIANCSKDVFQRIQDHVVQMKERIEFKAQSVTCGECDQQFSLPITMDQSNFFAVKS
jgi:hypothetical protein